MINTDNYLIYVNYFAYLFRQIICPVPNLIRVFNVLVFLPWKQNKYSACPFSFFTLEGLFLMVTCVPRNLIHLHSFHDWHTPANHCKCFLYFGSAIGSSQLNCFVSESNGNLWINRLHKTSVTIYLNGKCS